MKSWPKIDGALADYVDDNWLREAAAASAGCARRPRRLPRAGMQISAHQGQQIGPAGPRRSAPGARSRSAPSPATPRSASPRRCRPTASSGAATSARTGHEGRAALLEGGRRREPHRADDRPGASSTLDWLLAQGLAGTARPRLHRRQQGRLRRLLRALPEARAPGRADPDRQRPVGRLGRRSRGQSIATRRRSARSTPSSRSRPARRPRAARRRRRHDLRGEALTP